MSTLLLAEIERRLVALERERLLAEIEHRLTAMEELEEDAAGGADGVATELEEDADGVATETSASCERCRRLGFTCTRYNQHGGRRCERCKHAGERCSLHSDLPDDGGGNAEKNTYGRYLRRTGGDDFGLGPLGHDPNGSTNTAVVNTLRDEFFEWYRATYAPVPETDRPELLAQQRDREIISAEAVGQWKKHRTENDMPPVSRAEMDSRLDMCRLDRSWGLTEDETRMCYPAEKRLQKLVAMDPSCLEVEWDKPFGEFFYPIDEDWMESPNELHGWKCSLCTILSKRIWGSMANDGIGLITGSRCCPQPVGKRYMSRTDYIRRWNYSRGFCGSCPRHIFLETDPVNDPPHDDICTIPGCKISSHRAQIQRFSNTMEFHFEENIAKQLVCRSCSSSMGVNRRYVDV